MVESNNTTKIIIIHMLEKVTDLSSSHDTQFEESFPDECYSITSPQLCNIMQELQIKLSDNHGVSSKSFTILNQGTFENGPECHSMTLPQFYKRSKCDGNYSPEMKVTSTPPSSTISSVLGSKRNNDEY
ncbi:hypothetical protein Glove_52g169 [Diversispora epigaea]|uniref:Uncharacterized protein n=1 Tax=Diversispora epigaea TaxID=1348612 RepID=A0A397JHJ3_9GLOM|nr:hypothetical protein Glove_52g169 [Diversispora epigaea]